MVEARKIRIAVIDHDAVFLGLVRRILESDGYEAIIGPEGTAAHDVIATEQPAMRPKPGTFKQSR